MEKEIREIYKPDKRKIALFVIIAFNLISNYDFVTNDTSIFGLIFKVILAIISYPLSCRIVWKYDTSKKKKWLNAGTN